MLEALIESYRKQGYVIEETNEEYIVYKPIKKKLTVSRVSDDSSSHPGEVIQGVSRRKKADDIINMENKMYISKNQI